MERKYLIGLILVLTMLVMGRGSQAEAKPEFFIQIPDNYEKSCQLCHTAPPNFNDFGQKFQNVLGETGGNAALAFQKLNNGVTTDSTAKTGLPEHKEQPEQPKQEQEEKEIIPGLAGGSTTLDLDVIGEIRRGEQVELKATLLDDTGKPVRNALITFTAPASLFVEADMYISQARTNSSGEAAIRYTPKLEGDIQVIASYDGGENFQPAEANINMSLESGITLYKPDWSVQVPFMSPILILVALLIVWSAYAVTANHIVAIWREGRLASRKHEELQDRTTAR